MDFPELPDDLPEGSVRKKWQAFNTIICQAAEPRIEECPLIPQRSWRKNRRPPGI